MTYPSNKGLIYWFVIIMFVIVLSACGGQNNSESLTQDNQSEVQLAVEISEQETGQPTDIAEPTQTPEPTNTSQPPTITSIPSTATPTETPTTIPSPTLTPTLTPIPTLSIPPTPAPVEIVWGKMMIPLGHRVCAAISERSLIFAKSIFREAKGGAGIYYLSTQSAFSHLPEGLEVESIHVAPDDNQFISHCISAKVNMPSGVYYLPYDIEVYEELNEIPNPATRQYVTEGTMFFEIHVLPPIVSSFDEQGLIAFTASWNLTGENDPSSVNIYLMNGDGSRLSIFTSNGATQPAWSPDGTQLAYKAVSRGIRDGIFIGNIDTGEHVQLIEEGKLPSWSPDGTKIAFADRGIKVINLNSLEIVDLTPEYYSDEFSWSPDSTQIVFQSDDKLYVVDVQSRNVTPLIVDDELEVVSPTWSPTENKIAILLQRVNGTSGLFIVNSDGTGLLDLTPNLDLGRLRGFIRSPAWAPDGTKLVFFGGGDRIHPNDTFFVINSDGTNLHQLSKGDIGGVWFPDSTRLVIIWDHQIYGFSDRQIYTISVDGSNLSQISNENVVDLHNSFKDLVIQP